MDGLCGIKRGIGPPFFHGEPGAGITIQAVRDVLADYLDEDSSSFWISPFDSQVVSHDSRVEGAIS